MKKIIYFDETSATDYIEISNGGRKETSKEHSKKKSAAADIETNAKGDTFGLIPFFNLSLKAGAKASALGENIIKTYISNTILTDFLLQISKSEDIAIFKNLTVKPPIFGPMLKLVFGNFLVA